MLNNVAGMCGYTLILRGSEYYWPKL